MKKTDKPAVPGVDYGIYKAVINKQLAPEPLTEGEHLPEPWKRFNRTFQQFLVATGILVHPVSVLRNHQSTTEFRNKIKLTLQRVLLIITTYCVNKIQTKNHKLF